MLQLLVIGLGAGAAFQAWRQYPADGPATADSLAVVFIAGLLAAYLAGRWRGRNNGRATATAVAVADATAVSSSTVNVAVVMPGGGAATAESERWRLPDSMPWSDGLRPQITADELDGADLSEFVSDHDHETA